MDVAALRRYRFVDGGELRFRHYAGLSVVVVILAWKLIRGISPSPTTWYFHVMVVMGLGAMSFLVLMKNRFRLRTFDLSLVVFIFCLFVVVRATAFGIYRDTFTAASLTFFAHLFLTAIFTRVSDRSFFRGLSFVFTGLVVIEILGIVDYVMDWGVVDYAGMEAIEGIAPIEGVYAGKSFILFFLDLEVLQVFFGRMSGIAGTPYASSGLMAAIAAFAMASRRWLLLVLAVAAILFSSTGSAVLSLFMSGALMFRKKPVMYIPFLLLLPFVFWVFQVKGFGEAGTITEVYLPLELQAPWFEALVAVVIGEGRHASRLHGELRVFGLMFSLGIIGLACVLVMLGGWLRGTRLPSDPEILREYRAASYFLLTLFFATIHYQTLFVYPNIAIVVALLALVSSRYRIAWSAADLPARARLRV